MIPPKPMAPLFPVLSAWLPPLSSHSACRLPPSSVPNCWPYHIFSDSCRAIPPPLPPAPTSVHCMCHTSCSHEATPSLPHLSLSTSCSNALTCSLGPALRPCPAARAEQSTSLPAQLPSPDQRPTLTLIFSPKLRDSANGSTGPHCKCIVSASLSETLAFTLMGKAGPVLHGT